MTSDVAGRGVPVAGRILGGLVLTVVHDVVWHPSTSRASTGATSSDVHRVRLGMIALLV